MVNCSKNFPSAADQLGMSRGNFPKSFLKFNKSKNFSINLRGNKKNTVLMGNKYSTQSCQMTSQQQEQRFKYQLQAPKPASTSMRHEILIGAYSPCNLIVNSKVLKTLSKLLRNKKRRSNFVKIKTYASRQFSISRLSHLRSCAGPRLKSNYLSGGAVQNN